MTTHYVDGNVPKNDFTQAVNEEVIRVKQQDEMRREYMTLAMELRAREEEGIKKGITQGISQANQITIMNLIDMRMPVDSIARIIGQTPQYVEDVIKQSKREGHA